MVEARSWLEIDFRGSMLGLAKRTPTFHALKASIVISR